MVKMIHLDQCIAVSYIHQCFAMSLYHIIPHILVLIVVAAGAGNAITLPYQTLTVTYRLVIR